MAKRKQEKTENAERFVLAYLERNKPRWLSTKEINAHIHLRAGAERTEVAQASYVLRKLNRRGMVESRNNAGQWWRLSLDLDKNMNISDVMVYAKEAAHRTNEALVSIQGTLDVLQSLTGKLQDQLRRQQQLFDRMEHDGQSGPTKGS